MNTRQKHLLEKDLAGELTALERDELAAYKTAISYTNTDDQDLVEILSIAQGMHLKPYGKIRIAWGNGYYIFSPTGYAFDINIKKINTKNKTMSECDVSLELAEKIFKEI